MFHWPLLSVGIASVGEIESDSREAMADNEDTVPGEFDAEGNRMQVDVIGSPTELAEGSDVDLPSPASANPADVKEESKVKIEKRKRERKKQREGRAAPVGTTIPDTDDEDLESPTKRASGSGHDPSDRPLTASEIRELLVGHVQDMRSAWTSFQGRLDKVEHDQARTHEAVSSLQCRAQVVEKDVARQRQVAEEHSAGLENLTAEVKNMKVRLDGIENAAKKNHDKSATSAPPTSNPDPWGEFLRRRDQQHSAEGARQRAPTPGGNEGPDRGDLLTDDEKKTLVLGGWLQDTKRSTIEEESSFLFELQGVKEILDADKLLVYGPRRSVGMLKFKLRDGEEEKDLRERMWTVVRTLAQAKHSLPSTRTAGDERTLWASFVKTKNARLRSSHASMIRRVTIALAKESHLSSAGGVGNGLNLQTTAYDIDWNLGTVWCGTLKLGSSTHRAPKDEECVTMTGGWVSITAVSRTALCSCDEAKRAFELEL